MPEKISAAKYRLYIEPLREQVKAMIGYPPPGIISRADPVIKKIGKDKDGTFFRVTLPLLEEGYKVYGLLIKPRDTTAALRKPLAVAIHGGGGTSEAAAGILGPSNYNDMGRKMAKRGHIVWLPACHEKVSFDSKMDVHRLLDLKGRLVGTTLPAIDLFGIIKSTEKILHFEEFTRKKAVVLDISYGGFRALFAAAISDLFAVCISSCYFNSRRAELERYAETGNFADWFFHNTLSIATDVELCQLICPRPLFIEVGIRDNLFPVAGAWQAASKVKGIYRHMGQEKMFGFDAFDGGHEFSGVKAMQFLDRLNI